MSTATANGRPQRKQLSDQLDRLDAILDVLAEGLPGAVGDAVRDGTRTVFKDVIAEALGDPAVVALLRRAVAPAEAGPPRPPERVRMSEPDAEPTPPPVVPRRPSFWARCKAALRGGVARFRRGFTAAVAPLADGVRAVRVLAPDADLGRSVRRAVIVALIVGGGATVLALNSHPVATALSAVGVGLSAFALQAVLGAHRLVRRMFGSTG